MTSSNHCLALRAADWYMTLTAAQRAYWRKRANGNPTPIAAYSIYLAERGYG